MSVKTYFFPVKIEQEDDGRRGVWIETLPGFAAWVYTEGEALAAVERSRAAYLEILVEKGQRIPAAETVETIDAPVVAVTL